MQTILYGISFFFDNVIYIYIICYDYHKWALVKRVIYRFRRDLLLIGNG